MAQSRLQRGRKALDPRRVLGWPPSPGTGHERLGGLSGPPSLPRWLMAVALPCCLVQHTRDPQTLVYLRHARPTVALCEPLCWAAGSGRLSAGLTDWLLDLTEERDGANQGPRRQRQPVAARCSPEQGPRQFLKRRLLRGLLCCSCILPSAPATTTPPAASTRPSVDENEARTRRVRLGKKHAPLAVPVASQLALHRQVTP